MLLTIEFHEDFPGPYINYFPFLFFLSYVGGGQWATRLCFFSALGVVLWVFSAIFSPLFFLLLSLVDGILLIGAYCGFGCLGIFFGFSGRRAWWGPSH